MINIVQQYIMYDKLIISFFVGFILHRISPIVIVKNSNHKNHNYDLHERCIIMYKTFQKPFNDN